MSNKILSHKYSVVESRVGSSVCVCCKSLDRLLHAQKSDETRFESVRHKQVVGGRWWLAKLSSRRRSIQLQTAVPPSSPLDPPNSGSSISFAPKKRYEIARARAPLAHSQIQPNEYRIFSLFALLAGQTCCDSKKLSRVKR